jgi:hypothetical protein
LKNGSHAEPGRGGLDAITERPGKEAPKIGAERALDPALHHVDAPQQERDGAGQIQETQRRVHAALLGETKSGPNRRDRDNNIPIKRPASSRLD